MLPPPTPCNHIENPVPRGAAYANIPAVIVTGLCECVSAIGPLLGGGHSLLQHRHGFAADNLVSARVVLADGKAVTVSSTKQPELFWALRGAGHNFGVVTSFELKVYDVPKQDYWTIRTLTFTQDKLERFFETWNELEVKYEDPGLLVVNAAFLRLGSIDESYVSYNTIISSHDTPRTNRPSMTALHHPSTSL